MEETPQKLSLTEKIKALLVKYREQILYLIFGGLTTVLNWGVYFLCTRVLGWEELLSNGLAWVAGVLFAFFTNKLFVFESKSWKPEVALPEFGEFVGARLLSLLVDEGFMLLTVKILHWPDLPMKIFSNVIVIIINYFFSKLIIFRKKEKE